VVRVLITRARGVRRLGVEVLSSDMVVGVVSSSVGS
jgi:hypothetical protein